MEMNQEQVVASPVNSGDSSKSERKDRPNSRDNSRRPARPGRRDKERLYEEKVVTINRVSKTVKGGRRMRFSVLVVIGDGKGTVGFGTGKANEVPDAIKKAIEAAKKNLYKVTTVKGDTFPHEIIGKYGACSVFLKPAPDGTGVIAGGPVRAVLELAGIKNTYSKVYGSRTPINIVRATINAIENLKSAGKIASLRGKTIQEIKG